MQPLKEVTTLLLLDIITFELQLLEAARSSSLLHSKWQTLL